MIEIYADGGYEPILDNGGWAAVVVDNGKKQVFSGAVEGTTNNRMEITAVIEGLAHVPADAPVVIHTDSEYLLGCMTKNWQRKANTDLFGRLDAAVKGRKVQWRKISDADQNPYHKDAHGAATAQACKKEVPAVKPAKSRLTHIDTAGRPKMVDVGAKPDTRRVAVAKGLVRMKPETFELITGGKVEKGDVLTVAQLAGIMGAKQTPHLIPLCHPILIDEVKVDLTPEPDDKSVEITATVQSTGKTGVEMEALTAVAVAALTVYDMCKAVDRGIKIENIRLVSKSGGKSGSIILE